LLRVRCPFFIILLSGVLGSLDITVHISTSRLVMKIRVIISPISRSLGHSDIRGIGGLLSLYLKPQPEKFMLDLKIPCFRNKSGVKTSNKNTQYIILPCEGNIKILCLAKNITKCPKS
jgi:hypothetical protein